jgi:hypothetical protein
VHSVIATEAPSDFQLGAEVSFTARSWTKWQLANRLHEDKPRTAGSLFHRRQFRETMIYTHVLNGEEAMFALRRMD